MNPPRPRLTMPSLLTLLLAALMLVPATSAAAPRASVTTPEQREAAAVAALDRLRSPYRLGSAGPRRFDCSGLVIYAFRAAGHELEGRSSQELFRQGARIRRATLRRGDLVWTWDRGYGHVGIYVGRGRYVHAPGAGRRVQVAPLPHGRAFVGAVRP